MIQVVLVFLGHLLHRLFNPFVGLLVGVVVWLGPAFTKLLVVVPGWGGFSPVWALSVGSGGSGWCSCPYFENCIVDASIFVVFCCVTSY